MKNKRGQIMLAILFAFFIFIFGMIFVNFLINDVTTFRDAMGCSDVSGISDGTKITCLIGDGAVPYWILGIISLAGGAIFAKLLV